MRQVLRIAEEVVDVRQGFSKRLARSVQEMPDLAQTAFLAFQRRCRRAGILGGENGLRPIEGGETESGLFAMRDGQCPKRAPMKGSLERNDNAAFTHARRARTDEQRGFDGILHCLGAGIHDKMPRGSVRG